MIDSLERIALIVLIYFYVPKAQINEALIYAVFISSIGLFARGVGKEIK
jgi:hypothetical protein